jgi:hypothetical protein
LGVSCSRCRGSLRTVDPAHEGFIVYEGDHSSLPTLYSGVICTRCGRIECTTCRLGGATRPCFWCGGKVEPAYDYAIHRHLRAAPPTSRLLRNVGLVILVVLAAFGVQRIISPKKASVAAEGAASRVAEVNAMSDPEALAAIARDGEEDVAARIAAVRKLDNDALLEEIARDDSAPAALRESAVNTILDQSVLATMAQDSELDPYVREAVIKRLDAPDVLRALAANDSEYENIQKAARDRLRRIEIK